MERLVILPFSVGCISKSSVAVCSQQAKGSKSDTKSSSIGNKEEEEEKGSRKNSFKPTELPKPSTGIHRLLKSVKSFSLFEYKEEEEMEMEIGNPTDVKHVTHIGLDGYETTTTTTTHPFISGWDHLIPPDFQSHPFTQHSKTDPPLVHAFS